MTEYDCVYVLKYIYSLWLPSFDENYGPDYWPMFHSYGSNDLDVLEQTLWVMDVFHPNLLLVYLGDTDHEGHSGIWENYTSAIYTADSIVGVIWDRIKEDPNYKDQTLLFVTNDHGRHDDEHGGFQHHGDGCEGCRHIQFLAAGPTIRKNYVSTKERFIPDMAVTASHWLEINPEMATGQVMHEIFEESAVEELSPGEITQLEISPNPVSEKTKLSFSLKQAGLITLTVYDGFGYRVAQPIDRYALSGEHSLEIGSFFQGLPAGIYFYSIDTESNRYSGKMIISH